MDESNVYRNMSEESRQVLEETSKNLDEPMEQEGDDAKQARQADRRRRREDRKDDRTCRCGRPISRRRRRKRTILSQNPFIIYYLEMYYKDPERHVTEVARQAGKDWCAMSEQDKEKYIRLAEKERQRRSRRINGVRRRRRTRC